MVEVFITILIFVVELSLSGKSGTYGSSGVSGVLGVSGEETLVVDLSAELEFVLNSLKAWFDWKNARINNKEIPTYMDLYLSTLENTINPINITIQRI